MSTTTDRQKEEGTPVDVDGVPISQMICHHFISSLDFIRIRIEAILLQIDENTTGRVKR